MFNYEKSADISLRIVACQIFAALIQSSPKIASYFEPSDIKNIQSLCSLAISSFYTSHAGAIPIITISQNDIPLLVKKYKNSWEQSVKLKIYVGFSLFFFITGVDKFINFIIFRITNS